MKNLLRMLVILGLGCAAEAKAFTNDIALPSHLYMLGDARNEIFFRPFVKRWRPYDDHVRVMPSAKDCKPLRHLSHVVTFDRPVDGSVLSVRLVNSDEFETVRELKPVLRVGACGTGAGDVTAQVVGDSFTQGGFYKWALLQTNYVPRLTLVGLRTCELGQGFEGRGGWTLNNYFTVPRGEQVSYHGFMHPADGRYWGDRAFWKWAHRCSRKPLEGEARRFIYVCGGFDTCVGRFDADTGTLLAPQEGDVQFDPGQKSMVRFDGTTWRAVDEKSLRWSFDYGKYLSMWGLAKPQFVFVVLGLNDFIRSPLDVDYAKWGEQIRQFKESYLKACPGGRFVVCTPCSANGSDDNWSGEFYTLVNAKIWRFRDWLIRTFDGREAEGWYLLDTALATDNDWGYQFIDEHSKPSLTLPYSGYRGQERLRVQRGNPHPYPNYPAMSVPLAAFIQYYRDRK